MAQQHYAYRYTHAVRRDAVTAYCNSDVNYGASPAIYDNTVLNKPSEFVVRSIRCIGLSHVTDVNIIWTVCQLLLALLYMFFSSLFWLYIMYLLSTTVTVYQLRWNKDFHSHNVHVRSIKLHPVGVLSLRQCVFFINRRPPTQPAGRTLCSRSTQNALFHAACDSTDRHRAARMCSLFLAISSSSLPLSSLLPACTLGAPASNWSIILVSIMRRRLLHGCMAA